MTKDKVRLIIIDNLNIYRDTVGCERIPAKGFATIANTAADEIIAGYAEGQGGGMWVKASERLPKEFTRTHATINGLVGTITIGQYKNITVESGIYSWPCDIGDILLNQVEWLDEQPESTTTPSPEEEANDKRIIREIICSHLNIGGHVDEPAIDKLYQLFKNRK